jgi:valyl-tRNA synthetase
MPHKLIAKICYKCKNPIEPLPLEQWFVKMEPLAKEAIGAVKLGKIKIYPNTFEKRYFQFLENIRDWNISRQIVWGIQIPAWKCSRCREWVVTQGKPPQECKCGSKDLVRDHDTFDTWFSSGQWPYATLKTTNNLKFYPTDVMETGYDILPWWVARMAMLGIYIQKKQGVKRIEKQIPFKSVLLHGLVNDPYGKKMSKSKGNVVNPLKLVDQYGADAVRFALIYGNATGNDQALSYPKLDASRKFTNKLWNMARFIEMKNVSGIKYQVSSIEELKKNVKNENDKKMIKKIEDLIGKVTTDLEKYNFNYAAEGLYEFIWHEFADKYIEDVKNRINPESYLILNTLYLILLKLLHPFMPFVTEEIYLRLGFGKSIMIDNWPACHAS